MSGAFSYTEKLASDCGRFSEWLMAERTDLANCVIPMKTVQGELNELRGNKMATKTGYDRIIY